MNRRFPWTMITAGLLAATISAASGCALQAESDDEAVGSAALAMTGEQRSWVKDRLLRCYHLYDNNHGARAACFEDVFTYCLGMGTEQECKDIFETAGIPISY
jgi:hypothetical protein